MSERVVILGASDQPDRYAHRAFRMLREHGHEVIPVHPTLTEIEGVSVVPDLRSVEGPVDTLTLYVRPSISESVAGDLVAMKPGRVLFNPGTESAVLQAKLEEAGIPWEEACTLVLLGTGCFENRPNHALAIPPPLRHDPPVMLPHPITGLVAATHTPFHSDGSPNLAVVETQAAHLLANGVKRAFIGGTTGESHSLSLAERRALTERWMDVTKGSDLKVIVHVGANCLGDVCDLAAQAQALGAEAISALTPSYFKPRDVASLVACCAQIAAAAPELPFFFYDIPGFTGVSLPMPQFLEQATGRIPNLAGIKFTNPDGMMFQQCLHHRAPDGHAFSILWGTDECLLAGLALGATGAVGSTYNFAAPFYHRILAAFEANDFATARAEQKRSVDLVARLASIGYMGAAKAVMSLLGVPVGPARLPHANPDDAQVAALRADLEAMGFFEWVKC